jgi:hypothetical protein
MGEGLSSFLTLSSTVAPPHPSPPSEFRRTKTTDNPIHIIGFLSQWKLYLDEVEASTAKEEGMEPVWRGRKMNEDVFEKLSNEQAGQLYELMHATRNVWKT